ncbi:MAG: HAD hydrolase-like protein, partial [Muribaculaceae bacterium]|nr:HAD hydrolase-like protein [Muribaculaceae bacterium]
MEQRKIAALFDLDGVLIDTEPVYTGIWSSIDKAFPTGVDNFALKIKGTTLPDILSGYFPAEQHSLVVEMLKEKESKMDLPLFDGVEAFLGELRRAGIPAAIVTSSGDRKM